MRDAGVLLIFILFIVRILTEHTSNVDEFESNVAENIANVNNEDGNQNVTRKNDTQSDKKIYFKKSSSMLMLVAKPAGNTVSLKCPAGGNPTPNITWFKDGFTPERNSGATIHYKKWTMEMEECTTQDIGNYTCVVCNVHGCLNHTFRVDIIERFPSKPYIKEGFQKNLTVVTNGRAKFSCPIISDQEVYVKWIKNPYVQTDDSTCIENGIILQNGTENIDEEVFVIENVTHADEGWYTCVVSNSFGTVCASAYLKVVDEDRTEKPNLRTASVITFVISFLIAAMMITLIIMCCKIKK
ncbi:hypothetical protein PGB90_006607 [Kerria lacca]